jgi:hypothetical protein
LGILSPQGVLQGEIENFETVFVIESLNSKSFKTL